MVIFSKTKNYAIPNCEILDSTGSHDSTLLQPYKEMQHSSISTALKIKHISRMLNSLMKYTYHATWLQLVTVLRSLLLQNLCILESMELLGVMLLVTLEKNICLRLR